MRLRGIFVFVFIFVLNNSVFAGKIEKAFEALNVYNYFKAKELFEELLDKEEVASRYGLSIIHYRNDNPFHDLNLAYKYSNESLEFFDKTSKSQRKKLKELGIDLDILKDQKFNIENEYWIKTKSYNSIDSCTAFLRKFPDFAQIDYVKEYRDNLAFRIADSISSMESYRYFYLSFPDAKKAPFAKDKYERLLFEEKTDSNSIQSYVDFMHIYPKNKYTYLAENRIYQIATKAKKLSSYEWMVRHFPENPNIDEAWQNIFTLYFTDFSDEEFMSFEKRFPKFPLRDLLNEAKELRELKLLKIKRFSKWGFIDLQGIERIKSQFEFENNFSDGLALVANEDKVAYIDKKGRIKIPFKYDYGFDFIDGLAIVEMGDSVGVINKLGNVVIDFNYAQIIRAKDGVFLAEELESGNYIYLNYKGENIFDDAHFEYASKFLKGYSIVRKNKKFGLINDEGKFQLQPKFNLLKRVNDSILIAANEDNLQGIINLKTKEVIVDYYFDYISMPTEGYFISFKMKKYGFRTLDRSGDIKMLQDRYENDTTLAKFQNGYSVTKERNKFGLINNKGEKVFPAIFDKIGETVSFPIPCEKRDKWGYVTEGITLWENYIFDFAGPFIDGKAIVAKDKKYGIIDANKKLVLDYSYDFLTRLFDDLYIASVSGKVGVIREDGAVVIPFEYLKISVFDEDYLLLEKSNSTDYFDIENRKILNVQTKIEPDVRLEEEF